MIHLQNFNSHQIGNLSVYPREMEYIERASFIEIYGLNIA